jgi:sugar O-acyltransferase (sialic acid O-acetyltransferase NeuD family)
MENPVMILGAKTLGKIALDTFKSNDVVVYGFLDDEEKLHGSEIKDIKVLGSTENEDYLRILGKKCEVFVAIDDSKERKFAVDMLVANKKAMPINAIHHEAFIEKSATLGHGNLVGAFVKVITDAQIGSHNIIHTGTIIDYGAKIGNFVEIGAGSIIGAGVEIEDGAFIGMGSVIIGGLKIGKNARIGAGSVVIKPVNGGETVFGMPAQPIQAKHLVK